MEEDNNKYIRFDWAVKRILRDKANFGVLEGLITVLLEEPVHIVEILESEGNQKNQRTNITVLILRPRTARMRSLLLRCN